MGYNAAKKKMKKLGLLIALMCVSMFGFAQNEMIAVLQHNDTISTYYGTGAFVEAYNAAANGDVITLSAAKFNLCDIRKAITIYGAGCRPGNGFPSTSFLGSGFIHFEVTSGTLHVEGVDFGNNATRFYYGCKAQFEKCIFFNCRTYDANNDTNLRFCNCLIKCSDLRLALDSPAYIINSVLFVSEYLLNCNIYNSYIGLSNSYYAGAEYKIEISNSLFSNSIISFKHGIESEYGNESTNMYSNCVAINMPKFYDEVYGGIGTNTHRDSMVEVFETFDGIFNYYEEYILNEDFATGFLGSDGNEIGLHGGMMPFSLNLSYMIMKRCNVASKSTIDGKLSVDIEIDTEE